MANNNQRKPEEIKNEEPKELVEEAMANKPVAIMKPEKKGIVGWFKDLSTPAKVIAGVVTTAVVGAAAFGVKALIEVLTGGEDSDDSVEAETESPADE